MKKVGVLLLFVSIFVSGCLFSPEAIFKNNTEIQKFLDQYPTADFTLTHFSAEESKAEFAKIKEVCGKELVEGKELYKAEIKDSSSGLSLIAYMDVQNQIMECVRKFGTEVKADKKDPCKCPGETVGGNNYCYNTFGSDKDGFPYVCECRGKECKCNNCWEGDVDRTDVITYSPNCPGDISITYDKDLFYVGDTVKFTFKVNDLEGRPLPNQAFKTIVYQDGKSLGEESIVTDEYGVKVADKELSETDVGIYELVAFIKQGGCPPVSSENHFSVHEKTETDERVCCEFAGKGCAANYPKASCEKNNGKSYPVSYSCSTYGCRPETGSSGTDNCATSIDLVFGQEQYKVGDHIDINVIAFDGEYNRLPNKEFSVTATKDGVNLGEQTYKTDEKGFYYEGATVNEDDVGEYVYRAYIKEPGCDYVVDSAVLTVSANPDDIVCCEFPGKGCAANYPRISCEKNNGKSYPVSYSCSTYGCRPETGSSGTDECASKIEINTDGDSFKVGDNFVLKVALYDKDENPMKGKKFYIDYINLKDDTKATSEFETNEEGVFTIQGVLEEPTVGEYVYEAYINEEGCGMVSDKTQFTISAASQLCDHPYYNDDKCEGACHPFAACEESDRNMGCYECIPKCANDEYYNDPNCAGKCTEGVNKCVVSNEKIPCYMCKLG